MKKNLTPGAIVLLALFAFNGCGYLNHYKRSKEITLQQYLWTMRRAIDFYVKDKGKRPQSLNDLVSDGYLREIPTDPFTRSNKTWAIEREKESSVPNTPAGIIDVRSAADGADKDGKPYNRY
ncbi:MAG TPA: type II secretion system protein G [Blastocatellia bacterium]|nr:type II secretion system protein G [Blastocatellia bacterium]